MACLHSKSVSYRFTHQKNRKNRHFAGFKQKLNLIKQENFSKVIAFLRKKVYDESIRILSIFLFDQFFLL